MYPSTFQCALEIPKPDVSLKRYPGYEHMYARGKEKIYFFYPYKVDK